ncbi:hypothetical protein [Brachybacterium sp. GPGPB12]|uniref:hypothetical protein n=1 Tax=Brachybacterium sp. GPGPB12 TaxID=3023517 RepID=UPI0031345A07
MRCGSPEEESSSPAAQGTTAEEPAASDGDDSAGGASDEGGKTAAVVPQESYEVTPAPDGFVPPEPCTGEGAFYAELGGEANPGLPERGGESLTVSLESIEGGGLRDSWRRSATAPPGRSDRSPWARPSPWTCGRCR